MKRVLGLDLGTNSIGWAVVEKDSLNETDGKIIMSGSRIIPMDAAMMSDFDKGNAQSQTAERTRLRSIRKLNERHKIRRQRLNRVLSILKYLPEHYANNIDRYGNIDENKEPKIAWKINSNGRKEFLFMDSFEEMVAEIHQKHPDAKTIPYDWTLYYLRSKALHKPISKFELAWVLHSFLQKRGYYQLRGEEEEDSTAKKEEYASLKVISVEDSGDRKGNNTWWNVNLENGLTYKICLQDRPPLKGKTKDFIITTKLDKEGKPALDKDGKPRYSIRAPKDDDWGLMKIRTESQIAKAGMTVGQYIYNTILNTLDKKIRGQIVRTIERKYYREELLRILECQIMFHLELQDKELYTECIEALYPSNDSYRASIATRNFKYLIADDVIFYQRPLKSKKSEISDCPYETRTFVDKSTGEIKKTSLKCISRQNPLFQEFRLWQFISNLRIYKRYDAEDGRIVINKDITKDLLPDANVVASLYEWLSTKAGVSQEQLLKYLKLSSADYRWNYVEEKKYPAGETRAMLISGFKKAGIDTNLLTEEIEMALWHILYSVNDCQELIKALSSFAVQHQWPAKVFSNVFCKTKPFEDYGAYSEKAIKKLLPLMRVGKYWTADDIDPATRHRIQLLITGEDDSELNLRTRDKLKELKSIDDFQGLPVWMACYVVYGRHSESGNILKWSNPHDIDIFLNNFKQHSLHNPIVEQVVLETMRVVRDVWAKFGNLDEIHLELGRNLNQTAEQRKRDTERNLGNERANLRAKILLTEFLNPEMNVENVRPYSPSQQELLRIFEEGIIDDSTGNMPDDIQEIIKKLDSADIKRRPTESEILRYRNWLEQGYRSPYTNEIIPLSKLFTPAYQIEHIIPQSLYFNNSYNNKVICETEVNQLKSNQLGMEFVKNHGGEIVECAFGRKVRILTPEEYTAFVEQHYKHNIHKKNNLLSTELPSEFSSRQLNDSRYISKLMIGLLSNIVREDADGQLEEEAISKNLIVCTGKVTERLKQDWGLKDVWNEIIRPRFERLNHMEQSERFGHWENKQGKNVFQITIPLELSSSVDRKRIDHRHHAMDAITIACATRNMVNYLSNQASGKARYDLQHVLCVKQKMDAQGNYKWLIRKPWQTFTEDAKAAIKEIVVSFKQNLRVINKTSNHYEAIGSDGKKILHRQTKGDSWAIRKSMHKDTVFGNVNLRSVKQVTLKQALQQVDRICSKELKKYILSLQKLHFSDKGIEAQLKEKGRQLFPNINLKKIDIYYFSNDSENTRMVATRKPLDASFNQKAIEAITDSGIRKILLNHFEQYNGDSEAAFSPMGIEQMNEHITSLNNGIPHKPIYKVRKSEIQGSKFPVGTKGCRSKKFFEADKGTNLFFAIYVDSEGKRYFDSIPLNIVIERQKQGLPSCPEKDSNGNTLLFCISPGDTVYVPTPDEMETGNIDLNYIDKGRLYKMVSCTGKECHFLPLSSATTIKDKYEYTSLNKLGRALSGEMIKDICIPIKCNRLGELLP